MPTLNTCYSVHEAFYLVKDIGQLRDTRTKKGIKVGRRVVERQDIGENASNSLPLERDAIEKIRRELMSGPLRKRFILQRLRLQNRQSI